MKTITKINISVAAAVLLAVAAGVALTTSKSAPAAETPAAAASTLETNTHRLDVAADGKVTLVEFLDFECEVCGTVYPCIEQLRVESAAKQDQFEAMYDKMFQTLPNWGDSQGSKAELFRTFAQEIGLDLEQYDTVVADPATRERVQSGVTAGRELGVEGTPTIFVNDEMIELQKLEDIKAALDAALAS